MDTMSDLNRLLDFERMAGTRYFTRGIREIVAKHSHVTIGPCSIEDHCNVTAVFDHSEVTKDEIQALVSGSPYSRDTIEVTLRLSEYAHIQLQKSYTEIISEAEKCFKAVGVSLVFQSSDSPYIQYEIPEIHEGITFNEVFHKVKAFVRLCELYSKYPIAFSRFKTKDPKEIVPPLVGTFNYILTLINIERNSNLRTTAVVAYTSVYAQQADYEICFNPIRDLSWDLPKIKTVPQSELPDYLERLAHWYGYNISKVTDLRSN